MMFKLFRRKKPDALAGFQAAVEARFGVLDRQMQHRLSEIDNLRKTAADADAAVARLRDDLEAFKRKYNTLIYQLRHVAQVRIQERQCVVSDPGPLAGLGVKENGNRKP